MYLLGGMRAAVTDVQPMQGGPTHRPHYSGAQAPLSLYWHDDRHIDDRTLFSLSWQAPQRGRTKVGNLNQHQGIQWTTIIRIALAGAICVGYVAGWARVCQLREEGRRLDRLIAAEAVRQGELAHRRAELCNTIQLEEFALQHGMVKAPVTGHVVVVESLPDRDRPSEHMAWDAAPGRTGTQASSPTPHINAGVFGP
jgi:hypothetical protein